MLLRPDADGWDVLFLPMPSQANAFYFRSWKVLDSFASLSGDVDLPQGYDRLLVYMLARELSLECRKAINPDVERLYIEALANLKRMNHRTINGSTWEVSKTRRTLQHLL